MIVGEKREALSADPERFAAWSFIHAESSRRRGREPETLLCFNALQGRKVEIAMPANIADQLGQTLSQARDKRLRKEMKM